MSKFVVLLLVASLVSSNYANNYFDDDFDDYEAFNLGKILSDLPKPDFFDIRRQVKKPKDRKPERDESSNYNDIDVKKYVKKDNKKDVKKGVKKDGKKKVNENSARDFSDIRRQLNISEDLAFQHRRRPERDESSNYIDIDVKKGVKKDVNKNVVPDFSDIRRQLKLPEGPAFQHQMRPERRDESSNYIDIDVSKYVKKDVKKDVHSDNYGYDDVSSWRLKKKPYGRLNEPPTPEIGLLMDIQTSSYFATASTADFEFI